MSQPPQFQLTRAMQELCQQSQEAWQRQDYQKSIGLLEQAARKEPSNPHILLLLGRLHGLRYDYETAERHFEKALKLSQGNVRMLEQVVNVCGTFRNFDMMQGYLERACQKKSVSIDALVATADTFFLDNRIDQAAEALGRAGLINRKDPRVMLGQAVLKRQRKENREAETLCREIMTTPEAGDPIRARAAYHLASMFDSEGRYDEAMSALLEAKAIMRAQSAPLAAPLHNMQVMNKEMGKSLTASLLERWRAEGPKFQPPRRTALLSGHPRSGTTLIEQVLDGHSDVVSIEETSLMHDEVFQPLLRSFPQGTGIFQMLDSAPPSVITQMRENYFRFSEMYLRKPIAGRLLLDKNPGALLLVPLMARFFPGTKFLVAMRDPRDVVISCFMQALTLTPASSAYLTLDGTVKQYANVMGFWREMLPRLGNQAMQVRYEDMIDDLPKVAHSVLEFLGLGYEEGVLKFHEHARKKRVNSPTAADVRKPLYKTAVGRWKNYEKYLEPYLPGLDRFLKEFNY